MSEERRARLEASGQVSASGEFEITPITAGEAIGHGWLFSPDVLRRSLSLLEGVEVFVDHTGTMNGHHSVRDLGGVLHSAVWDDALGGARVKLRTQGPSGPLVNALGREMLGEAEPKPRVGFSTDVIFQAEGMNVTEILRYMTTDLVYDPARGGAFLRALNSVGATSARGGKMDGQDGKGTPPPVATVPTAPAVGSVADGLRADLKAIQDMAGVQAQLAKIGEEVDAARVLRTAMCQQLLDSGLAASYLPAPAAASVRAQFAGKLFDAAELQKAIEDARKLVADLTAGAVVSGVTRVHAMFNSGDQLQAAVDDLLRAPRSKGSENLQVAKLRGVKEFYHLMTGDFDMHGGIYPERAQFQATTATFTGLVKNALNKALVDHWAQLGAAGYDWWKRVSTVEHFDSLNSVTWTIFGSIGALPTVAEGGEYTELKIADSPETGTFLKKGGYVGITLEAMDRDDARALRAMPRELANSGLRAISALVAALFTDNSAVGPTLADTGALFNATALTTAGGHLNLLTTALSAAEWEVVSAAVYNQKLLIANETGYYGTGAKMGVNPRFCLVPRALQLTAMKILYPSLENASNIYSENLQRGQPGDVVTVPEWTDATDWAAVVDPAIVPGIMIGERFGIMPEVFIAGDELSPAVFMNDESRVKVRHFVTVGVADFRPLHKSNV